jgi:hypothetical protein
MENGRQREKEREEGRRKNVRIRDKITCCVIASD